MIQILSHRGYWLEASEKNADVAFERTVSMGFGTETDVRDRLGELVISHDPAGATVLTLEQVLQRFDGTGLTLALNVKADGLVEMLKARMSKVDVPWFAFDMSGPEMVRYARAGLPYYTRHSDMEPDPICYEQATGVWLDSFATEWYGAGTIATHINAGKHVCVVSPELHGREPENLWAELKKSQIYLREGLALCTDLPEHAKAFFG